MVVFVLVAGGATQVASHGPFPEAETPVRPGSDAPSAALPRASVALGAVRVGCPDLEHHGLYPEAAEFQEDQMPLDPNHTR